MARLFFIVMLAGACFVALFWLTHQSNQQGGTLFFLGIIIGFLLGISVAGRWMLYKIHRDNIKKENAAHKKRKDEYL